MLRPASVAGARKGIAMPLMVLMFTVLIALVAFGVDIGYVQMVKSELVTAIDAANLAGASGLPVSVGEARKRAKDIARSNIVAGKPLMINDSDIELGHWDPQTNQFVPHGGSSQNKSTAVRVTAKLTKENHNPVNLIFAPILGIKSVDLTVSAVAGFAPAPDIVIVQDITSSFSAELADAKDGDQALIDALYLNGSGRSDVGFVVHTGWGTTLAPLQPISSNYTALTQIISNTKLCGNSGMPVCSGTDIASGLEEAIKVFSDPNYTSSVGSVKAIVLVSDGEPTQNSSGAHPKLTDSQLLTLAQQKADEAWAQNIHIYVVYFNRDGDQSAAAKVATLKRGSGDFVQVSNPKHLPDALEKITRKLPLQLLR
jgi:Flp pilus assembly protein TadG